MSGLLPGNAGFEVLFNVLEEYIPYVDGIISIHNNHLTSSVARWTVTPAGTARAWRPRRARARGGSSSA